MTRLQNNQRPRSRPTSSPAPQQDARRQSGQTVRIGARIDAEEFYRLLEGQVIDDTNLFSQNSKSGRTTTTTIAPPRRQIPCERLRQKAHDPLHRERG